MSSDRATDSKLQLTLRPVNSENWRQVAALKVTAEQGQFVAEPTYYWPSVIMGLSGNPWLFMWLNRWWDSSCGGLIRLMGVVGLVGLSLTSHIRVGVMADKPCKQL